METRNYLEERFTQLCEIESAVCDVIFTDVAADGSVRAFGNCPMHLLENTGIILSAALAGKRVLAILNGKTIRGLSDTLEAMNRLRTPAVFILHEHHKLHIAKWADTGTILIQNGSWINIGNSLELAHELAEKELRPVILFLLESSVIDTSRSTVLPLKLPASSSVITSPSPLQELLFGKKRRRIPIWFNVDQAVALGSQKDRRELGLELASNYEYNSRELAVRIKQFRDELKRSETIPAFSQLGKDAGHKVILADFTDEELHNVLTGQKTVQGSGWTWIGLSQLYPLPDGLEHALKNTREICVLESMKSGRQGWLLREMKTLLPAVKMSNCIYNLRPNEKSVDALLQKLGKGKYPDLFWLDIPLSIKGSVLPKHEVLLQHSKRLVADLEEKSIPIPLSPTSFDSNRNIPLHVREFSDRGAPFSRIGRFNDDVILPGLNEAFADPFRQLNTIPPATALFSNPLQAKTLIPEYQASECTACGECLIHCPHNAIPAIMLKANDLLETAIKACNTSGSPIRRLMPLRKNYLEFLSEELTMAGNDLDMPVAIRSASIRFLETLGPEKPENLELRSELETIAEVIPNTRFARTENWFAEYEKREIGSGLLFSLAFDPDSCTACGICETSCEPGAIRMIEKNGRSEMRMREAFLNLHKLPDTAGETIRKLSSERNFSTLAATFLSRHFTRSYSGGAGNDDQIPERTIIRSFLAIGEQLLQTKHAQLRKRVKNCIPKLSDRVREQLSNAVPKGDLDELMGAIGSGSSEVPLEQILADWKTSTALSKVDARSLRRKLRLLEDLKKLDIVLESGAQGSGRALYSIVLDESLAYLNEYPWNAFSVPTFIAPSGTALDSARSLNESQAEMILDNLKILYRAELEANGSYDPDKHDKIVANLTFEHLSEEERGFIPPVCLIATDHTIAHESPEFLAAALGGKFPLRCLVMERIPNNPIQETQSDLFAAFSEIFLRRTAYLARIPLYRHAEVYSGMLSCWSERKSSVFITPIPNLQQVKAHHSKWLQIVEYADECRGGFDFIFRPSRAVKTIAQGLEISEKIDYQGIWNSIRITFLSEGVDKEMEYAFTWADFLRTCSAYQKYFKQIPYTDRCLPLAQYLELDPESRSKKVPVVIRKEEDHHLSWLEVDDFVVYLTELKANQLRFAMELSGMHSNFPEKIRAQFEKDLRTEFEKEREQLERSWEMERAQLEQAMLLKIKADIKNKLVQLSGVGK
ncbi:MAG: 4Fe-4S binding protein [Flavobacteriales bacterium]|nr:4Fe-4S binding protein [Flavobacteriales bacterium]